MADIDEVAALKRELETLKLQLEQERNRNVTTDSTKREQLKLEVENVEPVPRRTDIAAYVPHTVVGSRRGKWWLRDRQILLRSCEDGVTTLKVRETWAWSGRKVILDKIVQLEEKMELGCKEKKPHITSKTIVEEDIAPNVMKITTKQADKLMEEEIQPAPKTDCEIEPLQLSELVDNKPTEE